MLKDLLTAGISFVVIAFGYYYVTHSFEEIMTDIIKIISAIVGSVLLLRWGKTFVEELGKRGDRGIENLFNPTPILGFTDSNTTRESTNLPPNDRDYTAKASTEPSTAKFERIEVTESKEFEILNEVTKFLTEKTKEGKLWLNTSNNVNTYLLQIAQKCEVHKAVIVAVIKRYPDEFRIIENEKREQYAYSVTAYDEKLRATQAQKNSTEVVFESTTPTPNSTTNQSRETQSEVYV
ncbi:MAG: hypothetical protein IPL26_30210 [Leptospiraceae bacterium]|nr:hypothetical protein [Leptospiraceae bacterium]